MAAVQPSKKFSSIFCPAGDAAFSHTAAKAHFLLLLQTRNIIPGDIGSGQFAPNISFCGQCLFTSKKLLKHHLRFKQAQPKMCHSPKVGNGVDN